MERLGQVDIQAALNTPDSPLKKSIMTAIAFFMASQTISNNNNQIQNDLLPNLEKIKNPSTQLNLPKFNIEQTKANPESTAKTNAVLDKLSALLQTIHKKGKELEQQYTEVTEEFDASLNDYIENQTKLDDINSFRKSSNLTEQLSIYAKLNSHIPSVPELPTPAGLIPIHNKEFYRKEVVEPSVRIIPLITDNKVKEASISTAPTLKPSLGRNNFKRVEEETKAKVEAALKSMEKIEAKKQKLDEQAKELEKMYDHYKIEVNNLLKELPTSISAALAGKKSLNGFDFTFKQILAAAQQKGQALRSELEKRGIPEEKFISHVEQHLGRELSPEIQSIISQFQQSNRNTSKAL
jgi:hypothetical protein